MRHPNDARPGRVPTGVSVLGLAVIALFLAAVLTGRIPALAHGTHATFLSPGADAIVARDLTVHIRAVRHPFPYVFVRIRRHNPFVGKRAQTATPEKEQWSGLLPLQKDGYRQTINTSQWQTGIYVAEAQFLGDVAEHVQQRVFAIGR